MELFLPDRISLNLIRWTLSPSFIHLMDCASGKGLFDGNLGRSIYETAHPWTERPERQRQPPTGVPLSDKAEFERVNDDSAGCPTAGHSQGWSRWIPCPGEAS